MKSVKRAQMSVAILLPTLFCLCSMVGCSGKKGTITGTVTFGGKTLPAGTVTFYSEKGKSFGGEIGEDGKYTVKGVPPGTAKVTVRTVGQQQQVGELERQAAQLEQMLKMSSSGAQGHKEKKPSAEGMEAQKTKLADLKERIKRLKNTPEVPKPYTEEKTTSLSYTIKGGSQTIDIDIPKK